MKDFIRISGLPTPATTTLPYFKRGRNTVSLVGNNNIKKCKPSDIEQRRALIFSTIFQSVGIAIGAGVHDKNIFTGASAAITFFSTKLSGMAISSQYKFRKFIFQATACYTSTFAMFWFSGTDHAAKGFYAAIAALAATGWTNQEDLQELGRQNLYLPTGRVKILTAVGGMAAYFTLNLQSYFSTYLEIISASQPSGWPSITLGLDEGELKSKLSTKGEVGMMLSPFLGAAAGVAIYKIYRHALIQLERKNRS